MSGALVGLQGSYDFDMGHKGPVMKGLGALGLLGPIPTCNSIIHSIHEKHDNEYYCSDLQTTIPIPINIYVFPVLIHAGYFIMFLTAQIH